MKGYSVEVWNQVTGDDLGFGAITTPEELAHYLIWKFFQNKE